MKHTSYSFKCEKGKGNYYRTYIFHYSFITIVFVPLLLGAIIVLCNPFWFRTALIKQYNNSIERLTNWRHYKEYKIYLGTDPEVWHLLKD
jgi:hypothetical protein